MPTVVVTILSRICAEHTNQRSTKLVHSATLIRLQLERNGNDIAVECVLVLIPTFIDKSKKLNNEYKIYIVD